MLLPWGETTVIGHILSQWRELGARQVAVVCRETDESLQGELRRLGVPESEWIFNTSGEEMFSSIRLAAGWRWDPKLTHFGLVLGDQPQIRNRTLVRLMQVAEENREAICQPSFAGRAKHPVILPGSQFLALHSVEHGTLRNFLEASTHKRVLMECEDESLNVDLDTPKEYDAAAQKYVAKA